MSGETLFSQAADELRRMGWAQAGPNGGLPPGRVCLYFAGVQAHHDNEQALDAYVDGLKAHLGVAQPSGIFDWNDDPERTVEDVLLVLKELHVKAGGA